MKKKEVDKKKADYKEERREKLVHYYWNMNKMTGHGKVKALEEKKCSDKDCKMTSENCEGLEHGMLFCCFHAFSLISDKNCEKCRLSLLHAMSDLVSSR